MVVFQSVLLDEDSNASWKLGRIRRKLSEMDWVYLLLKVRRTIHHIRCLRTPTGQHQSLVVRESENGPLGLDQGNEDGLRFIFETAHPFVITLATSMPFEHRIRRVASSFDDFGISGPCDGGDYYFMLNVQMF